LRVDVSPPPVVLEGVGEGVAEEKKDIGAPNRFLILPPKALLNGEVSFGPLGGIVEAL
jgi:hypothetical protein